MALAQPRPHEVTPCSKNLFWLLHTRGPPLSPCRGRSESIVSVEKWMALCKCLWFLCATRKTALEPIDSVGLMCLPGSCRFRPQCSRRTSHDLWLGCSGKTDGCRSCSRWRGNLPPLVCLHRLCLSTVMSPWLHTNLTCTRTFSRN